MLLLTASAAPTAQPAHTHHLQINQGTQAVDGCMFIAVQYELQEVSCSIGSVCCRGALHTAVQFHTVDCFSFTESDTAASSVCALSMPALNAEQLMQC